MLGSINVKLNEKHEKGSHFYKLKIVILPSYNAEYESESFCSKVSAGTASKLINWMKWKDYFCNMYYNLFDFILRFN